MLLSMALRDELKKLVNDEVLKTNAGLETLVSGDPVAAGALFPIQYTRAVLEAVYRLADEVDALRAQLDER